MVKSRAMTDTDKGLVMLREEMQVTLATHEDAYPILKTMADNHPELVPMISQVWGVIEQLHTQQNKALAMMVGFKAALDEAQKQLAVNIREDNNAMSAMWDAGTEYGRGQLRQETIDLITQVIDRDEHVVERALRIFFDGGILDEYAVDMLDDLILHISTDSRLAKANNFDDDDEADEDGE